MTILSPPCTCSTQCSPYPLLHVIQHPALPPGWLVLSSVSNLQIPPCLHHGISLRVSQFPLCPLASMCLHQCSSLDPICARMHCSVCSLPCPDPAAWPPRNNVSPLCSHRPTIRPAQGTHPIMLSVKLGDVAQKKIRKKFSDLLNPPRAPPPGLVFFTNKKFTLIFFVENCIYNG